MNQNDPLKSLQELGEQVVSMRDSERAANRARFPELAALIDQIGPDAKLLWAKDANGEIGKRPKDEPGIVYLDRMPLIPPTELMPETKRGRK